jgi:hypothetical protein
MGGRGAASVIVWELEIPERLMVEPGFWLALRMAQRSVPEAGELSVSAELVTW